MKPKDIIITSLIFLSMTIFAVDTASMGLRGHHIFSLPQLWAAPAKTYALGAKCSAQSPIAGLDKASAPELRALSSFQTACGSYASGTLMVFTDMPKDAAQATDMARQMATRLQEFHRYGVTPLVVMEPVTSDGFVDFAEFKNGAYDPQITAYFQALKTAGLTDDQLGTWVPFPEANLPYWNHHNVKAEDFGFIINRYVTIQKHFFPGSKASVMLNSATYENDDFDWANGEYISLVPYIKNIQPGLIDSFGLQGFPWSPRASTAGAGLFDPSEYLNYRLATEVASKLGIKKIWFNTGSFGRKYTLEQKDTVTVAPEKRLAILGGVVDEALKLKAQGYDVSINLFAEDKSAVSEATDWSYWAKGQPLQSPDAAAFHDFAHRLTDEKIPLWLFDR